MSQATKPEGVRAWFERTTKKSRRALIIATVVSTVVMAAMWIFCSTTTLTHLQTFNGALTVPLWGGLWIFFFIFGFLIPSREASFRAQESVERGIELIAGSVEIWTRVGLEVEKQIPIVSGQITQAIAEVRAAVKSIEAVAQKNQAFVEESRPAVDALKRIEDKIEREMKTGIVEDIRIAIEAVKMMGPIPVSGPAPSGKIIIPTVEPDLKGALKNIVKKKEPIQAPVQS